MKRKLNPLWLTRELLSLNTINPPGREEKCAKFLGKLLEDGGFKVDFYGFGEERANLVARKKGSGGKAPICFTGHMDTVPLGTQDWSQDPFAGEIEEDRIYGRGASDMKAGVAAMVMAALRWARLSGGKGGVTLVITAGEETGSQGAAQLAGLGNVLGEAGAIVVGEPTANYPLVGHKGSLWVELKTTGVAAHGSMPEQGVNAIYKAVEAVEKLRKFHFGVLPHPVLGGPTLNVGTMNGGLNINSVPDRATMGVDIRTVPGLSNRAVYERLQVYLGEEIEMRRVVDVDSVMTDPQDEWVQEVFGIMESLLNEHPEPRGVTYFTDASILTPAFGNPPTVILGPGEPEMAHKTNEFCYVSRIEQAAEAYFQIAATWCDL